MKKVLLSCALAFSANAIATDFNGYIVKFKQGSKAYEQKSFKSVGDFAPMNVSFGNFATLNGANISNKNVQSLSNHPDVEYVEPNWIIKINP